MKKFAIAVLAVLMACPMFAAEAPLMMTAPDQDLDARMAEKAELYTMLASFEGRDKITPFQVQLPVNELAALKTHTPTGGPLWIGVTGDVGFSLFAADKTGLSSKTVQDGNLVLTTAFSSPGATGVRLHLKNVQLPPSAGLYVYDRHGQAFGPYDVSKDSLWTNTVAGDEIIVQVHLPLADKSLRLSESLFDVAEISHMGDSYALGFNAEKAFCAWNDSCITNAECENIPNNVQPVQDGVAYLLYNIGSSTYLCSGGLLNDTNNSGTPYLLTANHCFDTQSSASSLEAYFQWTVACGASCGSQYFPPASVPRTVGSTLLATDADTDFTMVQLSQAAPSGSTFLGWTTSPVANSSGTQLYRVSHPAGSPQAYSEQSVNTSAGTCGTLPRGDFIYSDATLADTEGGSSGSPVVNGSGQVVGQLFGACGATPSTTCDNDDRTVDGAFAVTFPAVAQWLDPGSGGGGPTCGARGDSCSRNSDCCSNRCRGRRGNRTCR